MMTFTEATEVLGNIGEFVASIGVLISLVYLAFQINKNTETQRTSTYQSVVSDFGNLNQMMANSPDLSNLFVRGLEEFDELEQREKERVVQVLFQFFHYFENMYYQHKRGYLEEELWLGWKRMMLNYFSRPGTQSWWSLRRKVFSESFATFLESEEPEEIPSYKDLTIQT